MVFSARGYSTALIRGLYVPVSGTASCGVIYMTMQEVGQSILLSLINAICSAMNDAEEPLAMNVLYSPVKGSTSSNQSPDDPYQPSEYEVCHLHNIEHNQDRLCQLGLLSPSGSLTGFGSSYTALLKQGVATANDAGGSNPPVSLEHEPVGRAVDRRSGRGRGRTSTRVWHAGCSTGNRRGSRHRPSTIDDPGSTNVNANANVAIGGRVAGSRRGHGRGVHGGATCSPSKPAALQVQQDWTMCSINEIDENFQFVSQNYVIDHLLSDHCKSCAQNIQSQLSLKLSLHSMEANELNLFHLLISSAFDSIIEFTNESLNEKNLIPLSYGDFCCFIGTLLMTSVFNTSIEKIMGAHVLVHIEQST